MNTHNTSTSRRQFLSRLSAPGLCLLGASAAAVGAQGPPAQTSVSVKLFGARGDGQSLDTVALQRAIDACAQDGGGVVAFPAGRYLSGTLFLKSRVTLDFDPGATLLGSTNLEHYPRAVPSVRSYTDNYTERSLIYGEHLQDV